MSDSSMTKDPTATRPKWVIGERSRLVWESLGFFLTSMPALIFCAISSAGIVAALRLEMLPGSWLVHRYPAWAWITASVAAWITMNLFVVGFCSLMLQTSNRQSVSRICLALGLVVVAGTLSHFVLPARFLHSRYCGKLYLLCWLMVFLRALM